MLKSLKFNRLVLNVMGMWFDKMNLKQLIYLIFVVIVEQWIYLGFVGHIHYTINTGVEDQVMVITDIACIMPDIVLILFQVNHFINRKSCKWLHNNIDKFQNESDKPNNFDEIDEKLLKLSKRFLWIFLLLTSGPFIASFFITCENHVITDCGLISYSYIYMDTFYTPARQIFFFSQLLSTYLNAFTIVYCYLDYFICIQCILSMFKHLNLKLDKLKYFKTRSSRKVHIKSCVIYHSHIIKLMDTLNSAYKNATISIFIAPVMLSVIIFQILSGGNHVVYNVTHMSIWILVLIASCGTGESMIEHSLSIVNAAYDSIPFDGDTESQKDIILIIRRASRPLTLSIGSFSSFTNPFALNTLKFSYTVTTYLVQKE